MAVTPTSTVAAQRWVDNTENARQKIVDGVTNTTKNPGQLAVNQQQAMRTNLLKAIDSGRWAAATLKSGIEGWRTPMLAKGIDNMLTGVRTGQDKYDQAVAPWLAFGTTVRAQIAQMPNTTIADKKARANFWMDALYNRKQQQAA